MDPAKLLQSAWKIIPQLASRDIQASVDFYTKTLGFYVGGVHVDEETGKSVFASIAAGDKAAANIYLSNIKRSDEEEEYPVSSVWIALGTEQLDELYLHLRSGGAVKIAEEIDDKPWGYRQFTIRDPDGHRLTFFKFLEGGNPGKDEDDAGD